MYRAYCNPFYRIYGYVYENVCRGPIHVCMHVGYIMYVTYTCMCVCVGGVYVCRPSIYVSRCLPSRFSDVACFRLVPDVTPDR